VIKLNVGVNAIRRLKFSQVIAELFYQLRNGSGILNTDTRKT